MRDVYKNKIFCESNRSRLFILVGLGIILCGILIFLIFSPTELIYYVVSVLIVSFISFVPKLNQFFFKGNVYISILKISLLYFFIIILVKRFFNF